MLEFDYLDVNIFFCPWYLENQGTYLFIENFHKSSNPYDIFIQDKGLS